MPSKEITERFRSIGWKAFPDKENEACTNCLHCVGKCTVKAISLQDGHIVIDQDSCLGCGFCAAQCPQKAITLRLTKALKGTIKEYFEQGGLTLDV